MDTDKRPDCECCETPKNKASRYIHAGFGHSGYWSCEACNPYDEWSRYDGLTPAEAQRDARGEAI